MLELAASNCHGPQDMTATFSHTSNLVFARRFTFGSLFFGIDSCPDLFFVAFAADS
jgi:hypothetical protein